MNDVQIMNNVMKSAIQLPFVNVDREQFLKKELQYYLSDDVMNEVLENGTINRVNPKLLDKIANGCIKSHLTTVTMTSAIAGVPGGWFMAGTIPADIAQFFGHALCLMQKLLYLYGFPSITDAKNNIDDETLNNMTLFLGVMFGNVAAANITSEILEMLAKGTSKKIGRMALTRTTWYPVVKEIGKWLGIKVTRDMVSKAPGKIIPIIGAPISGGLTYLTFRPMANRLHKHLKENMILNESV